MQHGRRAVRAATDANRRERRLGWIDRWGIVTAQVFGWAALGPSLIPRRWWMTALALSLSQISGYVAGRTAHLVARGAWAAGGRLVASRPFGDRLDRPMRAPRSRRRPPHTPPRNPGSPTATGASLLPRTNLRTGLPRLGEAAYTVAGLLGAVVGIGTVASLRASITRQAEIADLVRARMPAIREQLAGLGAGAAIAGAALALEWVRISTTRRLRRRVRGIAPSAVAAVVGAAVPAGALWLLSDRTVRRIWRLLVARAVNANDLDVPGVTRPTTPLRSGSPASPIAWSALGRHGRAFVGSGPRSAQLVTATGSPALDPIRVFASVTSWRSISGAARAAASELRRTGAYDRGTLLLATTTGTGWLSDWSVSAVEHLTDGDCATAALQYTVLPSGLAALGQPNAPIVAARALLRAIERDLAGRPADQRPRVYVTGESLGALGVLGSVDSIDDLLARVDGGVLAGTPRVSKHWNALVAGRDPDSPEVAPVIDGGAHVRVATRPEELGADHRGRLLPLWSAPRLALLQHASDPVVWWSPSLLVRRPDWMRERAGRDVTRAMRWMPVVTFWQIATDMPASVNTPGGVAHRYFEEYVPAWAAVLGVDLDAGRLAAVTERIRSGLPSR